MSDPARWLDQHGCSVTKNFSYALHDFGRVVAQADDSIAADLLCMLQTEIKRMFPRFLAKAGQNSDIASDQRLQAGSDGAENRARTHDDASDDAECFYNSIPIQLKCRRGHGCIHAANL